MNAIARAGLDVTLGMAASLDATATCFDAVDPGICSATNGDEFVGDGGAPSAPDLGSGIETIKGSGIFGDPWVGDSPAEFRSTVDRSLREYGERHRIDLMRSRSGDWSNQVTHGIGPTGMLAVAETRKLVETLASQFVEEGDVAVTMDALDRLAIDMYAGDIWKHADDFGWLATAEAMLWLIMAGVTEAGRQLDDAGFYEDFLRVTMGLEVAIDNPEGALEEARDCFARMANDEKISVAEGGVVRVGSMDHETGVAMVADGYDKVFWRTGHETYTVVSGQPMDTGIFERMGYIAKIIEADVLGNYVVSYVDPDGKRIAVRETPTRIVLFGEESVAANLAVKLANTSDAMEAKAQVVSKGSDDVVEADVLTEAVESVMPGTVDEVLELLVLQADWMEDLSEDVQRKVAESVFSELYADRASSSRFEIDGFSEDALAFAWEQARFLSDDY